MPDNRSRINARRRERQKSIWLTPESQDQLAAIRESLPPEATDNGAIRYAIEVAYRSLKRRKTTV